MINKRLLFLSASVGAMSALLAGCNDKDENREFDSAKDCKGYMEGECTEVANPVKLTDRNAPRFRTVQECEERFGAGNCVAPRDGKISGLFTTMDSCEVVYGEGRCVFKNMPIAESDENGNIRDAGWVWNNTLDTDGLLTENQNGTVVAPLASSSARGYPPVVYHPIITPYSYFYPYTYGYWGGSPWYVNPPPRVGGTYYTSTRAASLSPGTRGDFRGSLAGTTGGVGSRPNAAGVGANSTANRAGSVNTPSGTTTKTAPSGTPSKAGSVGSTGGSKGGGFGGTGGGGGS